METCNKLMEKILWNKDQKKFMVFRKTLTFNWDKLQQHRIGRNPIAVKEEFLDLSVLGENEPKRSVKVPIVIKKTALDPITLNSISGYFSQNLEVKVLTDSIYKYHFLTVCENRVFIHNLDSGQTTGLALSGEQQGIEKHFLGTEKRLSDSEAQELMESGIPVYEKFQGEYRILV